MLKPAPQDCQKENIQELQKFISNTRNVREWKRGEAVKQRILGYSYGEIKARLGKFYCPNSKEIPEARSNWFKTGISRVEKLFNSSSKIGDNQVVGVAQEPQYIRTRKTFD